MKEVQFKINNRENVSVDELEVLLRDKVGNAEFLTALDLKSNIKDTTTAMNSIGTYPSNHRNLAQTEPEYLRDPHGSPSPSLRHLPEHRRE